MTPVAIPPSRAPGMLRQARSPVALPREARPDGEAALAFLRNREAAPPTLEAAAQRLEALARRLEARGDRRAVFTAVYAMQVRDMAQELAVPGRYADPAWMTRLSLDFAQRYFEVFVAYERGNWQHVPAAWRRAFDHARQGRGPLVNDLLLPMNVHVNHDLALSAAACGADERHRADFLRFNEVMIRNVDRVQDLLYTRFLSLRGSLVGGLDAALGPLDEWAAGRVIASWRGGAWRSAQALRRDGQAAYAPIAARAARNARAIDGLGRLVPRTLIQQGRA